MKHSKLKPFCSSVSMYDCTSVVYKASWPKLLRIHIAPTVVSASLWYVDHFLVLWDVSVEDVYLDKQLPEMKNGRLDLPAC